MKKGLLLLLLAALALVPAAALAAPNTGTGDIAGVDDDLADSNTFNLNATTLALVKTAFLTGGTELADGDSVPSGTTVHFLVYINNSTAVAVDDITIQDVLDPAFTYTAGTIRVDNTQSCAAAVCTNPEEAAVFAAVSGAAALTDAAGDDVGSFDGSDTIDVGNGNEGTNAQADIAANAVYAVLITVTVD
jgi:hypothetical protein